MQIVLATRNQHKKQELVALLGGMDITIRTLDDFPDAPDVVEDGETCEANAMKKAVEIARYTGLPAVADDTGLEVDALGGRPGAFAARYAGEQASYEDTWRKLLQELRGIPAEDRARVLDRFVRLDSSRSKPGNGLGLSLVAGVMKLHGGTLVLEDNAPGLRAKLVLPLHRLPG